MPICRSKMPMAVFSELALIFQKADVHTVLTKMLVGIKYIKKGGRGGNSLDFGTFFFDSRK